jgi:electron transfer flavoprotein beta subunit
LKSIVFVKQVPDSTADVQVDNGQVTWGDATMVINPWDEIAVEVALLEKESHGGDVVAVSMGNEGDTVALKHALAMGCDEAVLISDPSLVGADSLVTARVLAAAVEKVGNVTLAIFGRQAIDSDAGVTAAQVARVLGWPILSMASGIRKFNPELGSIQVELATEEGKQVVDGKLPVVLTAGRDFAEPRFPSFMLKRKAAKAVIPVWDLQDLGLETMSSVVNWFDVEGVLPREIEIEMINGASPQEIAEKLADRILAEKTL